MKSGAGADGIDRRTRSAPRSASSGRIQHGKKKKKAGCRLPKAVEFLADLSEEEAAAHSPVVLLRRDDGGYVRYWREGGQVRCRDADSAGGESRPGALEALLASGRRNFEELFPKLAAELLGPSPDLDIVETAFRDGLLGSGAAMRRHQRKSKRFATRIGPVKVERTYYLCPDCGGGHFPLDRALGIEGESHAPGAASIIADAVVDCSYEAASRKLANRRRRGPTCRSTARGFRCARRRRRAFAARASAAMPRSARRRFSSSIRRRGGTRRPASRKRTRQRDLERLHRQRRRRRRREPQLGLRRAAGARSRKDRAARGRGAGGDFGRSPVDPQRVRGALRPPKGNLNSRLPARDRIREQGPEGALPGQGDARDAIAGTQVQAEGRRRRLDHRRTRAASRTRRSASTISKGTGSACATTTAGSAACRSAPEWLKARAGTSSGCASSAPEAAERSRGRSPRWQSIARSRTSAGWTSWTGKSECRRRPNVESRGGAPALGRGSGSLPAAFALRGCLNLSLSRVSSPRSSNRTCGFPASGFHPRPRLRICKACDPFRGFRA